MDTEPVKTRSGFVAIVGRPNVGKSTLLNFLVGQKLAGVSNKPQTTRHSIHGILTRPEGQAVFLDTPGLHAPQDLLGSWMIKEANSSLESADLVYWLVLPDNPHPYEKKILEQLKALKVPVFLLVNQVDRFPKPEILPVLDYYSKAHAFAEMIPISAKTGDQVHILIKKTFEHLPESPYLFPDDQISDQNERFIATEIIREKLYHYTEQEIPYSTAVVIEEFKEREDKITEIHALIVLERDSQKAIVIGKQGSKLKEIGQAARLELEEMMGQKVFLKLLVRVQDRWKKDKGAMRELGYE